MQKNEAQERVITNIDGQMIVIACPGSGKTTTILRRIHHMVAENGIDPEKILMITFTKAAADEMKSRYHKAYGPANGITFCTIHALCLALLKKFEGFSNESVLSNPGDILFDIIHNSRDINDKAKFVQDGLMDISRLKSNYTPLSQFSPTCCNDRELFAQIYKAYEERKDSLGQIDFDDMLLRAQNILDTDPGVLDWIQRKYQYIHVDEYQDTNMVQRDLIYTMAGKDGNLVVVGDDDQSIYAFRGASPKVMLGFKDDYPKAEQVYMTTNYRSDIAIIQNAKAVIANNKNRFPKKFLASSQEQGKVHTCDFSARPAEIEMLGRKVKELIDQGADPSEIAILYRTNAQADAVLPVMEKYGIPFYCNDRLESRYDHWIYRDIVSYHKVAKHAGNKLDVQRTITHPNRYFKGIHVPDFGYDPRRMYRHLMDPNAEDWKNQKLKERIYEYLALLNMIADASPETTMSRMLVFGDYGSYIKSYAKYRNTDVSEYKDIWDQYTEDLKKNNIKTFKDWESFKIAYEKKLADIQSRHTGVCLSTMHKSKGLEWSYVFVIDCVDGTIPYIRNGEEMDIEDERRLFYVAMTRAKHALWLYSYRDKTKPVGPSRFLDEMGQKKNF